MALDLKTGKEVYRGTPQLVETRPAKCDDGVDMCFTSLDTTMEHSTNHRVDLATGKDLSGRAASPMSGNFRRLGEGLYSEVDKGIETIVRVENGVKMWSRNVEEMFGPRSSTNFGWIFQYSEKLDLYIGSVGFNPTDETDYEKLMDKSFSMNLTDHKTVGFRAATGRVLWTADASEVWCSNTVGKSATKLEGGDGLPVRCEYTQGVMNFPSGKYQNAKAKLVGYDPMSGKAAWETEAVVIKYDGDLLVPTSSRGDTVLAGTPTGVKLLDTQTGTSHAVSNKDVFLCWKGTKYDLPPDGPYADLPEGDTGMGSVTSFPCNKNGKVVPALSFGALNDVSTTNMGMAIISLEGKVAGYKLR